MPGKIGMLCTALLSVCCTIAHPACTPIPAFVEMDADRDGTLSPVEASTAGRSARLFARLDLDGDRKLNPDEYNLLTPGRS